MIERFIPHFWISNQGHTYPNPPNPHQNPPCFVWVWLSVPVSEPERDRKRERCRQCSVWSHCVCVCEGHFEIFPLANTTPVSVSSSAQLSSLACVLNANQLTLIKNIQQFGFPTVEIFAGNFEFWAKNQCFFGTKTIRCVTKGGGGVVGWLGLMGSFLACMSR